MPLSIENLVKLKEFIAENSPVEPDQILGNIKYGDLSNGREILKLMRENNEKVSYFEIFGENGGGYTSYSLYKSPENIIYCVYASFRKNGYELAQYAIIENSEPFDKYFMSVKK
jgi:hypothetical protein